MRKGGVIIRRKYVREGKKGTINIVQKSRWNRIVEERRRKLGECRKANVRSFT